MRVFPRFRIPFLRPRRPRKKGPAIPSAGSILTLEIFVSLVVLALLLTGAAGRFLDHLHPRADALVVAVLAGVVGVVHLYVVRRWLPELRRKSSPERYDQQDILLDLSDVARRAQNLSDVYKFSVERTAEALGAPDVFVLVRAQETGNFVVSSSASHSSGDVKPDPADVATGSNESVPPENGGELPSGDQEPIFLRQSAFVVRRLSKLSSPLRLETEDLDAWKRAVGFVQNLAHKEREEESRVLRRMNSRVLVQIKNRSQLTGILSIGPRRSGFDFSEGDLKLLMSIAEQLAMVIDNANLLGRIVDQEKVLHEMALAASVQQRLFPSEAPESSAVQISASCKPAGWVGGDYYDFMRFENGSVGVTVADVAGKGLAAALLTFMIHAFLRSQALAANYPSAASISLSQTATSLKRLLFASTSSSSYVTLFFANYDQASGRLNFVNAGHNPPFILHANGNHSQQGGLDLPTLAIKKLPAGGPMLGLFGDCPVQEEQLLMAPGDCLFAYTDGAIDAVNRSGEEFGEDRLVDVVKAKSHLPAVEARHEILRTIEEWCEGTPQADDITLLVLKVGEAA